MNEDRELRPDEAEELFSALEADYARENAETWQGIYGFPHDCRCEQDALEGSLEEVPACYLNMVDNALPEIRRLRGFLVAIAESPSSRADILAALAAEALGL